jgi:hypothetical protein
MAGKTVRPALEVAPNLLASHLAILGKQVKDKITGFKGVAVSVSFDLYGCIQVVVAPAVGQDGKIPDSAWFDIHRLEILRLKPAMPCPDFEAGAVAEGKHGPSCKPPFPKMPTRSN